MNSTCRYFAPFVMAAIISPCWSAPGIDSAGPGARSTGRSVVIKEVLRPTQDPSNSELVNQVVGQPPMIQLVPPTAEELPQDADGGGIYEGEAAGTQDDLKPILDLSTEIQPSEGELPPDHAAPKFEAHGEVDQTHNAVRRWEFSEFYWEAPAMVHRPLYFEDENLERYGYSYGIFQPVASTAHFLSRVAILPYLRGATQPRECVYPLGYYRPGSCAPYYRSRPPFSASGLVQGTGVTVGLIYLTP